MNRRWKRKVISHWSQEIWVMYLRRKGSLMLLTGPRVSTAIGTKVYVWASCMYFAVILSAAVRQTTPTSLADTTVPLCLWCPKWHFCRSARVWGSVCLAPSCRTSEDWTVPLLRGCWLQTELAKWGRLVHGVVQISQCPLYTKDCVDLWRVLHRRVTSSSSTLLGSIECKICHL